MSDLVDRRTVRTPTGYAFITTHGIESCEHCLFAADWAVTQVMTIGTACGLDRHTDDNGVTHKAKAWRTEKGWNDGT